ncbi:MAG TPA: hypothetical protein VJ804_14910, partial [Acidimicrobiales bacterium]|nr:hypothetical protein [Acidimicrobiales bacterium]
MAGAALVASASPAGAQDGGPKITICHATGSASNPFVEITISVNAIPAHLNHQEGRDIIPAPGGRCPGGVVDPEDDLTICHREGNSSQTLTLPESEALAHLANHPDDTRGACPVVNPEDLLTICHREGNSSQTLTLPESEALAHLANHPGDTRGACPARVPPVTVPPVVGRTPPPVVAPP